MRTNNLSKCQQSSQSRGRSGPFIIPLSKIGGEVAGKLKVEKIPELVMPQCQSLSDRVQKYYQEYERLFFENDDLNNTLAEMIEKRNRLAEKFNSIKRTKVTEDAVKRKRRYARDIERLFICPIDRCHRGYGSEGSLSHHVRLKHLDFYQCGQYEIFIQKYIDSLQNKEKEGEEQPAEESSSKKAKVEEMAVEKKKGRKLKAKEDLK